MTKSDASSFPEFGKQLRAHRLRAGITTQAALADCLAEKGEAYDYTTISHWETGRRRPELKTLVTLIQILVEAGGIASVEEANHLLRLANMRSLSSDEIARIFGTLPPMRERVEESKTSDGVPPTNIHLHDPERVSGKPFQSPPLPPQGVFGRQDDLNRLLELLAPGDELEPDVPPVALRGMGGIGKTTLAIALARLDSIPRFFPDGVLWTAPGPNPTIRLLLDAWGRALGMDLQPERDETTCRDRLRAVLYQRRVLIIVDDVWQTVHGSYFQVGGPRCRTLFTTREAPVAYDLATRERTLRVDVIDPKAALDLLERLAPEAVRADEKNARRLCERLEFLPLGLTLAGRLLASEADVPTRMNRLVGELIERRQSRLQLLQAEGRPGLEEDQPVSLQAILGMSVERLDKNDQERFAMASVFGGEPLTWEIDAAAYVWECPVEEAEKTVSCFIQRGLVERRQNRYWMHALLADYAAEMMDAMGL